MVTVELETNKSALGWSKGTICSTVISQKGICEQGHNLHYKEYVSPRKHASVSHFVVIGLQICCSGFFPWSDQKRIGLISGDIPWNQSKAILKQVRSLSVTSCSSEMSACHLSCWKDDEQIFQPLLSRIHDGVCVCATNSQSVFHLKKKKKEAKPQTYSYIIFFHSGPSSK